MYIEQHNAELFLAFHSLFEFWSSTERPELCQVFLCEEILPVLPFFNNNRIPTNKGNDNLLLSPWIRSIEPKTLDIIIGEK